MVNVCLQETSVLKFKPLRSRENVNMDVGAFSPECYRYRLAATALAEVGGT
ncbi:MAG: hypothetical protein JW764_04080 [Chlorobiaceae bacterium]|nr:hypothetical protein [Chlorobiaceae bacterium]